MISERRGLKACAFAAGFDGYEYLDLRSMAIVTFEDLRRHGAGALYRTLCNLPIQAPIAAFSEERVEGKWKAENRGGRYSCGIFALLREGGGHADRFFVSSSTQYPSE